MNLLTIADALAARYAPGLVTPPTGRKNITAATARPPNAIPNAPFVVAWAESGDVTFPPGQMKGEHEFKVAFYYAKSEGDVAREYAALLDWVGILLVRLAGQTTLGVTGVMKAIPIRWEIGTATYAASSVNFDAILITVHVWTEDAVTLTP
jgi:hypothetical protein